MANLLVRFRSHLAVTFILSYVVTMAVPAQAIGPTDSKMILLSATGSRWGGRESGFTPHSFSVKSNRGNAIWHDTDPDHMCMINPENKSYMYWTLDEYADDVISHRRKAA